MRSVVRVRTFLFLTLSRGRVLPRGSAPGTLTNAGKVIALLSGSFTAGSDDFKVWRT